MKSKYIRLIRPIAWTTYLLPFTVGIGLGITPKTNIYHIIIAFFSFCFWMAYCFILNAIGDKDVDKYHNGKSKDMNLSNQPIITGEITEKKSLTIAIIFLFLSLIFALFINYLFFLLILIVDIFGYIYSMPPLRLKTKPITDIFCNAFSGSIIFIAGLYIGRANINTFMIIGSFIMASIFYIPTVLTDYHFDKKAGLLTSAVFLGPKKILFAMSILNIILIFILIIVFLTSGIELQFLSILIAIYSIIFTIASNIKLRDKKLYIHENWILVPFALLSIAFVIYGFLKLFNFYKPPY